MDGEAAHPQWQQEPPAIKMPTGGGAARGIGETFAANPAFGTGSMHVPIVTSPGRDGFGPALRIAYDTGLGNGPFGIGWTLGLPAITRKTDLGLPRYQDDDTFLIAGAEDLVPLRNNSGTFQADVREGHRIQRYGPRTEGLWARIERWTDLDTGDVHWRSISATNITTLYGTSERSRIADPETPDRVFSWLIAETFDDKGNWLAYEYEPESSDGVDHSAACERNRSDNSRSANRYVKRILYGNRISRLVAADLDNAQWHFEVVFDYDEDHLEVVDPVDSERRARASASPGRAWRVRPDPFSRYRPGFDLRTYRRCRRVLMFHRFDELGDEPCLVRSTEFSYVERTAGSFLRSVTQSGYIQTADPVFVDGTAKFLTYETKSLPPLEFAYSERELDPEIQLVESPQADNIPAGLDPLSCRWVDLDGEGMAGILYERDDAWYYKRNLGPGPPHTVPAGVPVARFGPLEVVRSVPQPVVSGAARQLVDLDGDGRVEVVDFDGPLAGRVVRTDDEWLPWRAFESTPNRPTIDRNVRFVDLSGRGLPDLLISEDDVLLWYPSLGANGFGEPGATPQALDEEKGPRFLFNDGTDSIYLADLCGDGLSDVVRIRNGEVAYWPNLGYGHFGAKITMDDAPWFDAPDQFDQHRVRLADVDGSGTADLIYLGTEGVRLYFNESGNRWSAPEQVGFPHVGDKAADVAVIDLLGDGTSCLVWSSPLPGDAPAPFRYLRLLACKPHLMTQVVNHMGAETTISYTPSTAFYAADCAAGRPWATKLPFPVHVIDRVESADQITGNRFVTRYAYHHGHYDGLEREFRGFAMVEQWDSEEFTDGELDQPPVVSRTWFHTGELTRGMTPPDWLVAEWYDGARYLPPTRLPADLDAIELHQASRALRGQVLRREIYSFDGGAQQEHPFAITETVFAVRLVHRRNGGAHAVFQPVERESLSISLERDPTDPHLTQGVNLRFDERGNVLRSAMVAYGRANAGPELAPEAQEDQERTYVTVTEVEYTDNLDEPGTGGVHRMGVPYETRSFELTGAGAAGVVFVAAELDTAIDSAAPLNYEEDPTDGQVELRLLSRSRMTFLNDDLDPMPLGQWDTLGLLARIHTLAFTPSAVSSFYGAEVTDDELEKAGYVHYDDDDWWIPSGVDLYAADAASRFYMPTGSIDPFGIETLAEFDDYDLLLERTVVTQAPWQQQTSVNDYRTLTPVMTTDGNGNRSAIEIDALGLVTRSARMGKEGSADGDTLADPTARMDYVLDAWINEGKPNSIRIRARERHGPANTGWRESWVYSNGSGGTALMKAQAAPGPALAVKDDGSVSEVAADPRWIGTGRTILNNKGNPIARYDPYFSVTHEYEGEPAVRELGRTPRFFYDPLGRNIRTESPNGTIARAEFDPWSMRVFDANDAVGESDWYADRGSPDPDNDPEPNDPEQRAAWLAAKHANTPAIVQVDSLGRVLQAFSDHGDGTRSATRTHRDITGRDQSTFDQLGRLVASSTTAMTGSVVTAESAEKGRSWSFADISGAVMRTWDEHGRRFRTTYDVLRRRVSMFAQEPGEDEVLIEHVVYGDRHPDATTRNLNGTVHMVFDQAGQVRIPELDFEGHPLRTERLLALDGTAEIDWTPAAEAVAYADIQAAADPLLESGEVFTTTTEVDALGRPVEATLADGTVVRPTYDEGSALVKVEARIRGHGPFREFLSERGHDAKGRPLSALHGNGVRTRCFYDPDSFRLTRLLTMAEGANPGTQALQDLNYTYDPVGNVVAVRDDAQQTHFFRNAVVPPVSRYEYDALYQLRRATGREHAGGANDSIRDHTNLDLAALPHLNDLAAVRTYAEEYDYDLVGNLVQLRHRFGAQPGVGGGWRRDYRYARDADQADRTNRLTSTSAPGDPEGGPFSATYQYDVRGNLTRMPNLPRLEWDVTERLRIVDLGGGGTATHVYATGGQRVRKIVDRPGDLRLEWIFLGPVRLFRRRRRSTGALQLERRSVQVGDNHGVIAQVTTKTQDTAGLDPANALDVPLIRYQYTNGLGSAVLETDEDANPVSYEEFHPFGTTAYWSAAEHEDVSLKRYRFSGKERDDESGLYYFGVRYYAPWLGRWTSPDPAGIADGFNLFRYCKNNPVMYRDETGMNGQWRTDWRSLGTEQDPVTRTPIDTVEEFERWAVRHGIQYTGTPALRNRTFWVAQWRQVEPGAGGPEPGGAQGTQGQGVAASTGAEVVRTNPEGHIHEVAQNLDDEKVAAYRERIQTDRGVAIRSKDPGSTSRTGQLRQQNQGLRDNFEASLPGGQRPAGTQIDHTVELQDIGRHNNTVRPQDHRVQPSSDNASQGSSQQKVNQRRLAQGIPEDVPAGAAARTSDMAEPRLQPGYRGRMRGVGYALGALGPVLTAWGASQVKNTAVRLTGYGLAAAEAVGGGLYVYGRVFMGGGAAGNPAGLQMMARGSGLLRIGGGAAGIVLGGYGLVTNFEAGEYGRMLGDASSVVGGAAVLAGAAPVAAIAGGVAAANLAGDWVESKVTPHTGRTGGVAAGTAAGAGVGAAAGAAIGVWFFGVGALPGAAVGAVVGGIAGFVGSFW
jgi:RHS repeat-associated protein